MVSSVNLPLCIFVCFFLVVQLSLDFDTDSLTTMGGHLGEGWTCFMTLVAYWTLFFFCLLLEFLKHLRSPRFKQGCVHRGYFGVSFVLR